MNRQKKVQQILHITSTLRTLDIINIAFLVLRTTDSNPKCINVIYNVLLALNCTSDITATPAVSDAAVHHSPQQAVNKPTTITYSSVGPILKIYAES